MREASQKVFSVPFVHNRRSSRAPSNSFEWPKRKEEPSCVPRPEAVYGLWRGRARKPPGKTSTAKLKGTVPSNLNNTNIYERIKTKRYGTAEEQACRYLDDNRHHSHGSCKYGILRQQGRRRRKYETRRDSIQPRGREFYRRNPRTESPRVRYPYRRHILRRPVGKIYRNFAAGQRRMGHLRRRPSDADFHTLPRIRKRHPLYRHDGPERPSAR